MLKISKKTEYAIIAILDMSAKAIDELCTAKDLSLRYNIPKDILGKVLQSLAKQGIITSHQGVKGGYQLQMPLQKINVNTVINAVEGPINLVHCNGEALYRCEQLENCNIKMPMEFIQTELTKFFNGITLQDFVDNNTKINSLVQIQGQ
jgi:Rrf2 family protein